ncbi:putative RNA methylase [Rhizobium tibeticum]|uniref:Methyltransferase domain-containing protein n=2 Tax=Rhizobium tibeticum TaxID=501024 RepID=A0A1H8V1U4_9HYPH|nr:putative RNA methylase [Rhizobium tibeticum]SEI18263.1 putative methyltransferase [Rhizobium tibeticum]SEP09366.1 Methyltransferase domain-containing protein [Rhizobium tibeticum]
MSIPVAGVETAAGIPFKDIAMTTIPFEARRFQSTAAYYTRYRVPYPDRLIERIAEQAGLSVGERVLDLGCGPGQLAIAFARLTKAAVIGLDPEPEMLEAAAADAAAAGVDIAFVRGSSYDLNSRFSPLKMTVMGRSFHWMDRSATLKALDEITVADGCVVLFGDRHISSTPDWRQAVNTLAETFAPERNADRERRKRPDWIEHESILLRSPFNDLERTSVVRERRLGLDDIVGRAFSTSVTSPQALGERASAFEAELRGTLLKLSPEGVFSEVVEIGGLMARRS